jgi:hypothetical protein
MITLIQRRKARDDGKRPNPVSESKIAALMIDEIFP